MADVTIEASSSASIARSWRSVVYVSPLVGYWFHIDGDGDFSYCKTTNGGSSWGASVQIGPDDTDIAYDVWFDKWTPGDTGTLIHMAWFGSSADDVFYRTLETAGGADTLGTQRTVFNGATAVAGRGAFVSLTKTRSGYLYVAYDIDAGAEKGFQRSTDAGVNWSADLASTFVEATLDEVLLFPASNTGDDNDCWAIYLDASADALTLKMWDSSAGSATESATIQTHVDNATDFVGQHGYNASVRHSDGHLILAALSERDTATADHQVYDINGTGSITALTSITTNIDDHYYPVVFIDQATDHIYVAYHGKRDGSENLYDGSAGTGTKIYYTKSTDGGTSWTAGDTAYSEAAVAQILQLWAPIMGPRFFVGWRAVATILGNFVNSIAFAAGTLAVTTDDDTIAADGTVVGDVGVTGELAATTDGDTVASTGTVDVVGTGTVTTADDTVAATGTVDVVGALTVTLADDTAAATGAVAVSGTSDVTLQDDTVAADGTVAVAGALSATQADDTITGDGTVAVVGDLAATVADDTLEADGVVGLQIAGELAALLADDALAAVGEIAVSGFLAALLDDDTLVAAGAPPEPTRRPKGRVFRYPANRVRHARPIGP
jgi:hypothetical protein